MSIEKNYINGIVIKEIVFENGGKQLKGWVKVDEFIEQLKAIEVNGSANIIIARRKEPSETGVTHYMYEDPWKPKKDYNDTNDPQYDTDYSGKKGDDDDDELPF